MSEFGTKVVLKYNLFDDLNFNKLNDFSKSILQRYLHF